MIQKSPFCLHHNIGMGFTRAPTEAEMRTPPRSMGSLSHKINPNNLKGIITTATLITSITNTKDVTAEPTRRLWEEYQTRSSLCLKYWLLQDTGEKGLKESKGKVLY